MKKIKINVSTEKKKEKPLQIQNALQWYCTNTK